MQTIRSKAEVLTRGVGGPGEDGYTAVQLAKPPLACILASPSLHQVLPGLEVVQTQPCTPPPPTMVYPTWTTGTRGGAFTWVPLPLGPGQHSRSSGSSTVNQAPWLHFGVTCRVQCLCVPAHSGAGLNNRRLSLARSALPASLPWVLQSELQTAEPFRFPQGSSERGWGHGVRLQSQPVRQKPGKDKIGQCLFWKARQLLWYVKSQSPRRSKVKRYLSLLFDFSLVPDPSLVLHSTLWDRKPSGWKGMRDFFLSLSFPLFFAKCWICIK